MINDILDLSKIEAGKITLNNNTFEMGQLLHEIENTIMPLMDRNKNRFRIINTAGETNLYGDKTRIKQILLNLLSNAAKFTRNGTVEFKIEKFKTSRPWIGFEVSDTGIGMSAEQQDRVFEAFTQAEHTTSQEYGGTGLGLTITQKLCSLMGGDIKLHSVLNQGSSFSVKLPLSSPDYD